MRTWPDRVRVVRPSPPSRVMASSGPDVAEVGHHRLRARRSPPTAWPGREPRMPGRRLDDVAVAARLALDELRRPRAPASCRATARPGSACGSADRPRDGGAGSARSPDGRGRSPGGRPACARPRRPRRPGGHGPARAGRGCRAGRPDRAIGSPVTGSGTSASPATPTARPPSRRTSVTRTRGTIRAPWAAAVARWARMPLCLAPRRQPNPQLPQSSQPGVSRRVGAASQPRAAAPRRMAWSLGGT